MQLGECMAFWGKRERVRCMRCANLAAVCALAAIDIVGWARLGNALTSVLYFSLSQSLFPLLSKLYVPGAYEHYKLHTRTPVLLLHLRKSTPPRNMRTLGCLSDPQSCTHFVSNQLGANMTNTNGAGKATNQELLLDASSI